MAYTVPAKAIAMAHELADKLKLRFSTLTVAESFDSDGFPLITIDDGAPATGEASMIVKVMPIDWPLAKDILGNAANIYTPHKILLGTESNFAGTTDNVADYLTRQQLLNIVGEIVLRGTAVEWYETAAGTAPTIANTIFAAAKLKASWIPDMYNGMTNQQ